MNTQKRLANLSFFSEATNKGLIKVNMRKICKNAADLLSKNYLKLC